MSTLRITLPALRLTREPARGSRGFTLVEILVVCAIIGIVMTMAIPAIYRKFNPDSMVKITTDLIEACCHARAYAILQGTPVDLVISAPEEDSVNARFSLQPASAGPASTTGGGMTSPDVSGEDWRMEKRPGASAEGINFAMTLPETVAIELMEVNFQDAMEWAEARVRFYPNGTSDEFKMILWRPDTNERRMLTLEVVTGLADFETDVNKFGNQ